MSRDKKSVEVSPRNRLKKPLMGKVLRVFPDGKTARVRVKYTVIHEKYRKVLRRHNDYLVHLLAPVEVGVQVGLYPCRRLSKRKSWVVLEQGEKGDTAGKFD